jgi:methylthioribulose-1-phosphate dehydratase
MNPHAAEMLEELFALAHWCAAKGWVPATSGNFSVADSNRNILISRSGFDKSRMEREDLVALDSGGSVFPGSTQKPSAESSLHAIIYRKRPEAHAIAHVHTIWNTLLSERFVVTGHVDIAGYELLKALSDVQSHAHHERVPVIANSQDYHTLARELEEVLADNPTAHGVLLSGHGLYTWGRSVAETRRHLEALEFLFEVEGRKLFGYPD